MYTLFTDTDSDLTLEMAKKYGYKLISMPYIINEKEIKPYEDWKEFDVKGFYDTLRSGIIPKTCAISVPAYISYFEPEFKEGRDILYVHFSKAMSGTFNAMELALEELKEKYPERKVYSIDTKGITINEYIIVKEVGMMYQNGKSIQEILDWAKDEVDHYATYFFSSDLKFFCNSGRISNVASLFGTILGFHPIIYMDPNGMMTSLTKVRGRKSANKALIDYVEKLGKDIDKHPIIIGHSDDLNGAEELKQMLIERFGSNLDIETVVVNPTCGCHCGPNGVGIAFHSIHK